MSYSVMAPPLTYTDADDALTSSRNAFLKTPSPGSVCSIQYSVSYPFLWCGYVLFAVIKNHNFSLLWWLLFISISCNMMGIHRMTDCASVHQPQELSQEAMNFGHFSFLYLTK